MTPIRWAVAIALLAAQQLSAQQTHLGDLFPLTHTRYGTTRGHQPLLLSNGRDPVVFWSDERHVRVARFANGRFGVSHVVAGETYDTFFDAVWTGTHFLVVSVSEVGVVGRLVDPLGEPMGEQFPIVMGWHPRLAFNGRNALLLFSLPSLEISALLLTPDGRRAEAQPRALNIEPNGRVALASNGDTFAALVPKYFEPQLMLFDARGQLKSSTTFTAYGTNTAIASDGERYLGFASTPPVTRLVEADGTLGPELAIDEPLRTRPVILWSGANWLVAYMRDENQSDPAFFEVVHLDAEARAVQRRDQRIAVEGSLAVIGGQVLAAFVDQKYRDRILLSALPLESSAAVPASITAKRQSAPAVASSVNGTLVAWQEIGDGKTTLHTGVRAPDGTWVEREIRSIAPGACYFCYEESLNMLAASDGREFILFTSGSHERLIRRLDAAGHPIAEIQAPAAFTPDQLLWSGSDYLMIGAGRIVFRMTPSGAIGQGITLPSIVGQSSVYGTDGDGRLLAVWVQTAFVNHQQIVESLSAVRLDQNFQPIDATPIKLAGGEARPAAIAVGWDGRQYVVTWQGRDGVMAAQVAATGPANPRVVRVAAEDRLFTTKSIAVPGGAAILWNKAHGENRLAFLRFDGSTTTPVTVSARNDFGYESGEIVPLANGDVGYLESSEIDGIPYDGALRLMMRVIGIAALQAKPDAPRLSARQTSNEIVLTWTTPRQDVDGYRVEYRVDGGPWTELSTTFTNNFARFTPPAPAAHTFRVRAWNDAGTGAYSLPATAMTRRRAVRF